MRSSLATFAVLLMAAAPLAAQVRDERPLDCDDASRHGDREAHCEIREETLAGGVPLEVDGGVNGGIRVRGWDRGNVSLRARVIGYGDTEEEARQIVSAVRLETAGGVVRASGPERSRRGSWAVSYELHVPQNARVTLATNNGGISVRDLRGTVQFRARNGGVRLENVAGDVRGETRNGGLRVELSGDRWDGTGLDVQTHNGGIRLGLPANYSAELETGTTNGRIEIDFPVTVQGRIGRQLNTTLGAGGPRIRVMTHNGGVRVRRR